MIGVHIEQHLNDFDAWFKIYKEDAARKAVLADYGMRSLRVLQDVKDPNHCIVIMEAPDTEAVDKFQNDPRIKARLEDLADHFAMPRKLLGMYNPHILESADENLISLVEHHINNLDAWIEIFKEGAARKPVMAEYGITVVRLLENIENRNHCITAWVVPDAEAAGKMQADPRAVAQREKISEHVIKPPEIIGTFKIHLV